MLGPQPLMSLLLLCAWLLSADVRPLTFWIQSKADAHRKDVVENRLKRAVCAGQVLLVEAQAQMRAWRP